MDNDRTGQPADQRPDSRGAWIFAGVLALIAGYALIGSFAFAIEIRRWPLGLATIILVCLAIYAVREAMLVRKAREGVAPAPGAAEADGDYGPEATRTAIVATVAFIAFLLGAYLFSFVIATALFVPAYMMSAGERRPLVLAGVTAGMLLAVWLMFGGILNAPVEIGEWIALDWLSF